MKGEFLSWEGIFFLHPGSPFLFRSSEQVIYISRYGENSPKFTKINTRSLVEGHFFPTCGTTYKKLRIHFLFSTVLKVLPPKVLRNLPGKLSFIFPYHNPIGPTNTTLIRDTCITCKHRSPEPTCSATSPCPGPTKKNS